MERRNPGEFFDVIYRQAEGRSGTGHACVVPSPTRSHVPSPQSASDEHGCAQTPAGSRSIPHDITHQSSEAQSVDLAQGDDRGRSAHPKSSNPQRAMSFMCLPIAVARTADRSIATDRVADVAPADSPVMRATALSRLRLRRCKASPESNDRQRQYQKQLFHRPTSTHIVTSKASSRQADRGFR